MVLDVVAEMHYNFLVILTVGYQSIILSIIPWAMSLSPYRIQAPHPPFSRNPWQQPTMILHFYYKEKNNGKQPSLIFSINNIRSKLTINKKKVRSICL